jgi:hypothetical protein
MVLRCVDRPHVTGEESDMKSEIVSFNEAVPELSTLLEIDGAELDRVVGGTADCPNLTSCGNYSDCNGKSTCIGKVTA